MSRRPVSGSTGLRRALGAPLLAVGLAGCVTTYEKVDPAREAYSAELAVPVAIPIPELAGGQNRLLLEFYSGILRRLQEAADDGDVALLESLVESYDKPNVPQSVKEHLQGYRAIARGIAFQKHVKRNGSLVLRAPDPGSAAGAEPAAGAAAPAADAEVDATPVLGEQLLLELRIPAMVRPVRLGARGGRDPVGFSVAVSIDDEYLDGSTRSVQAPDIVWVPAGFELSGNKTLTLPVEVAASAGDSVRRTVVVRVDLMPGYIDVDGVRSPIRRVTVGADSWTQLPEGHEVIAAQPLVALKAALADFTPAAFPSAYLAALMVPAEQRREACALLIDQVRFGRADQAQVAMAALSRIVDVEVKVGDRDGWLDWWKTVRR